VTEGERWTREALAELRAARFVLRAWIRFLSRSFARANEQRRERRCAFRELLALGAAGVLAWAAVGAAGRPGLAAAGAAWWLLILLMLDRHLGMLERPDGRPLDGLGAANLLTCLRAGLVPALPVLSPRALAAALFLAALTDVADGRLARSRDEITRLGFWLDGSVDSVLLATGAFSLARAELVPAWVAALVTVRWALPWLVFAAAYFVRAEVPSSGSYAPRRAPGFVLLTGLVLAALEVPGGAALAAAGAVAGAALFAATVVRLARPLRS
jgi:phosphatidylglycerophosphate synthase